MGINRAKPTASFPVRGPVLSSSLAGGSFYTLEVYFPLLALSPSDIPLQLIYAPLKSPLCVLFPPSAWLQLKCLSPEFSKLTAQTNKYPQPFSMDKEWRVLIDSFDLVISSVAFSSGSQICSRY